MTPITAQDTIEDHILMTQAHAAGMGALAALDEAEATINERRGEVVDTSGNVSPDYSRKIRDSVGVLFLRAACKDQEDFNQTAQALEATWWNQLRQLGIERRS